MNSVEARMKIWMMHELVLDDEMMVAFAVVITTKKEYGLDGDIQLLIP